MLGLAGNRMELQAAAYIVDIKQVEWTYLDERWGGTSVALRDVPGKSKTARQACSSYRPPVCAHTAPQHIRSEGERHNENRIKFIPSTATAIQL